MTSCPLVESFTVSTATSSGSKVAHVTGLFAGCHVLTGLTCPSSRIQPPLLCVQRPFGLERTLRPQHSPLHELEECLIINRRQTQAFSDRSDAFSGNSLRAFE